MSPNLQDKLNLCINEWVVLGRDLNLSMSKIVDTALHFSY